MSSMRPSQVRTRIMLEHSAIRERLELLDAHSARLLAGHPDALREAQQYLSEALLRDDVVSDAEDG